MALISQTVRYRRNCNFDFVLLFVLFSFFLLKRDLFKSVFSVLFVYFLLFIYFLLKYKFRLTVLYVSLQLIVMNEFVTEEKT